MKDKIFLGIFILIGCTLLYFGITNQVNLNKKTKEYVETIGVVVNVISEESGSGDSTMYVPIIKYTVNAKEYTVRPDYSTGNAPRRGDERKVKYNPGNPNEAIVDGFNGNMIMIGIGFMFALIPFGFILANTPFMLILIPVLFGGLGFGVLYFIVLEARTWNIVILINRVGIMPLVVSFLFIGVAVWVIFTTLLIFVKPKAPIFIKMKLVKIDDTKGRKKRLIFKDIHTKLSYKNTYVYETEYADNFIQNETYDVHMTELGKYAFMTPVNIDGKKRYVVNINKLTKEDFKQYTGIDENLVVLSKNG